MKIETKIHFDGDTLLVDGRLMKHLVSSKRLVLRYRKDVFIEKPCYSLIFQGIGPKEESYLPEKTDEALRYNIPSLVKELWKEKFLSIRKSAINVVGFEGNDKYIVALTRTRVNDEGKE